MQRNSYDIVIIGGGTAGCACAWTAAKQGLKPLLIEKNKILGGAITSQLVIPAMKTDDKGLNADFFNTLCQKANSQNAQITYIDGNKGWLNPLKLPLILKDMLDEVGCDVLFNTSIVSKHTDNVNGETKILSLCIETNHIDNIKLNNSFDTKYIDNINGTNILKKEIQGKFFVDSTGDADFSDLVGAEFLPHEGSQAMSLRFIMSGVDKKAFSEWLLAIDTNRNVTTSAPIDGDIHLSTACTWDNAPMWALKPLFDKAVESGDLKDADRAYFQVFSIAGETDKIAFNCPRILNDKPLNPLNCDDLATAKKNGENAIRRLAKFFANSFPGFENSQIYKIADSLGIRESRRVKGKYILRKEDIYNAKEFANPIAYSNYPIDVHSIKKDEYILDYVQKTYSIPLESLIVDGFKNLYVIGRCLSADFYAQAAVRIQPTCFSMGEGLAKYLSKLNKNISHDI